jgi:hypothetical protein
VAAAAHGWITTVAAAVKRRFTNDGSGGGGERHAHRHRRRRVDVPLSPATQAALGGVRSALAAARAEGAAFAEWLEREADDTGAAAAAAVADPLGLMAAGRHGGTTTNGGLIAVDQQGDAGPAGAFAAEAAKARALTAAMQAAAGWRF